MYQKIMLTVDLNEEASWVKALPTAVALCRSFGASLHVVTVLPDYRMPLVGSYFPKDFAKKAHEAIKEAQHEFIRDHVPEDITAQSVIVDGSPWEAIVKAAKKLVEREGPFRPGLAVPRPPTTALLVQKSDLPWGRVRARYDASVCLH